jgi:hypothetical protein
LGLAVAAGFALRSQPARTEAPSTAAADAEERIALAEYDARLRRLGQALAQERSRRVELEADVAELRRRIDGRTAASELGDRNEASHAEGNVVHSSDDTRRAERHPGGLDVQALVDAGFPAQQVRAFKEKMDQIELDQLYVRDLATREGWLDTPRFREESLTPGDVARRAREEMGDEFYDWMLYTSGHPNRVRIGDVLDGSAAAAAGLRPGDLILSYDEQRIFSPGELRNSTMSGTAGDTTALSLLRDGREVHVVLPRGPLGVRIELSTEEPAPVG